MTTAEAMAEAKAALVTLGYHTKGHKVYIFRLSGDLFKVYYDDKYFGVWDTSRKTFTD